jgi:hypothetical protein
LQKFSNQNSNKIKKEKGKRIRKRLKGRGTKYGLDQVAAHGPSFLRLKLYPASPSPAADEGAPHVITSEGTGMNTEAPERDRPELFAESG